MVYGLGLNPVSALRNAEWFWPEANCLSFDFGRLQKALPYQLNRAALLRFLQSFHGSVEKGRFSAFFRFLKQKGGVVRNGPLLYFSRPPLPQKPENRGNLDQPQATVVFLWCNKKSESQTFLNVLPPPRPATQNVWVLVTTFSSSKAHLWLAERARFRGSHGGAPETGFKS